MRGNIVTSLAIVCLLGAALAGCGPNGADELATNPGDRFALISITTDGGSPPAAISPGPAVASRSAGLPDAADTDSAVALAEGIPYVRSGPHKVPPFPLVLNESVQRYVNDFIDHNEGLKESFRRSRPYLPTMV